MIKYNVSVCHRVMWDEGYTRLIDGICLVLLMGGQCALYWGVQCQLVSCLHQLARASISRGVFE